MINLKDNTEKRVKIEENHWSINQSGTELDFQTIIRSDGYFKNHSAFGEFLANTNLEDIIKQQFIYLVKK